MEFAIIIKNPYNFYIYFDGEYSSAGRAPDCGSGCRGFDPHYSPHLLQIKAQTNSMFLNSKIFWGAILILAGLSTLTNVFRILLALLLMYWGLTLIIGANPLNNSSTLFFSFSKMHTIHHGKNFNVLFSKGIIDLTHMEMPSKKKRITINTVCGATEVKLNPAIPTKIKLAAAFARAELPEDKTFAFGTYNSNGHYSDDEPHLELCVNVVFGSVAIKNY